MKINYTTSSNTVLNIGNRIAKGGEGEVFEIGNLPGVLFKSYYSGMRTKERMNKLKYMCLNKPDDLSSEKFRICWPTEIVYENGEFAGFLMQKAFENSITPYHLCQLTIPEKFSQSWKKTYDRTNINGRINRLMLSANIAAACHRIHTSGKYVIADIKPQNLLITLDGKVSIIDMDSVQIAENNKILFKAPVSTPEYTPPEAKSVLKSGEPIHESWDSFSLGVLIYEILCGIHPYTGTAHPPFDNLSTIAEKIENNLTHLNTDKTVFKVLPPPHSNFDVYSSGLKNLTKSIFQNGKNTLNRPSIKTIGDALAREVQLTLAQKEKFEIQNAIENYHIANKQIENLKARIETLNYEISEKDNKIAEKIEKIDSWRTGFFVILFFAVVFIAIIIFAQNAEKSTDLSSKSTNYQELSEKYRLEKNDLLVENAGLKTRESRLISQNNNLEKETSELRKEILMLKSKAENNGNNTNYQNQNIGNQQKSKIYIKGNGVSLWNSPNISSSKKIYSCLPGQAVKIIRKVDNNVYYVEINGYYGYIFNHNNYALGGL